MIHEILEIVSGWVLAVIGGLGYGGVFILMALESANIPIPSEIIMPFSGFLVTQGGFSFWLVVFWGALGNLVGSLVSYYVAYFYGKRALVFASKFLFVHEKDFDLAEKWFEKYGLWSAFFSRLLPVVRTFISFPAGLFRVNIYKFSILTFLGSFIWSAFLTYLGYILGANWNILGPYFRQFDYLILAAVLGVSIWWFWWHLRHRKRAEYQKSEIPN